MCEVQVDVIDLTFPAQNAANADGTGKRSVGKTTEATTSTWKTTGRPHHFAKNNIVPRNLENMGGDFRRLLQHNSKRNRLVSSLKMIQVCNLSSPFLLSCRENTHAAQTAVVFWHFKFLSQQCCSSQDFSILCSFGNSGLCFVCPAKTFLDSVGRGRCGRCGEGQWKVLVNVVWRRWKRA